MNEKKIKEHLDALEAHYRPCACRSTTPFFNERSIELVSAHSQIPYRTYYQHDRDKILYSHFFRRLRLKTQIFPESTDDRLRTRLDHTLEVAQIARHFARQLRLNEDLVDAMALAHDIGHTPFGHSGERALHHYLMIKNEERERDSLPPLDGFKHNWQGLRVVDELDKSYPERRGLGLTKAVRIGILVHTRLRYKDKPNEDCSCDLFALARDEFRDLGASIQAFEVQVCTLSDDIAQLLHDFEDAIISGEMRLADVVGDMVQRKKRYPLVVRCIRNFCETPGLGAEWQCLKEGKFQYDNNDLVSLLLARLRSQMIFELTLAVVRSARKALIAWELRHLGSDTQHNGQTERIKAFELFVKENGRFPTLIRLKGEIGEEFNALKKEVEDQVVYSARVSRMDGKAEYILKNILQVYLTKPDQVPESVLDQFLRHKEGNGRRVSDIRKDRARHAAVGSDPLFIRAAVDYVAGMTDRFALMEYDRLYSAYPHRDL